MATTPITQLINTSITISGYSGYSGISGYSGTPGPTNSLNATNDIATTTLYPVMVGAAASNETPKVTTSKLSFDASTGSMSVSNLTANSNITGGNIIGIIAAGSNTITTTGNITGGNLIGTLANGNANVRVFANASITISTQGVANVLSVNTSNVTVSNLSLSNPGVGNTTTLNFQKTNDTTGLQVAEYVSDKTLYNFYINDNAWGTSADGFMWTFGSYTSVNHLAQPIYIDSGTTTRFTAANTQFYGNIFQNTAKTFSTSNVGGTGLSSTIQIFGDPTKLTQSVTGTITITALDVSGFTGNSGQQFWISLTGTGDTFQWGTGWGPPGNPSPTPTQTGLSVSTSPVTLSNGVKVTFSATTGGVAGDAWSCILWTSVNNTLGQSTITVATISGGVSGNANVSTVQSNFGLRAISSTYTDSSAAASATVGNMAIHALGTPTLAAANTGVTATNAATFYIQAPPAAGTNITITNPYSLFVATGNTFLGGNLIITGGVLNQSSGNLAVQIAGVEQLRVVANASVNRPVEISGGIGSTRGARVGVTNEALDLYTTAGFPVYVSTSGARTNVQLIVSHTGSSVNYLGITGAVTGSGPRLTATGSDGNIDLRLEAKGTGQVQELISSTYYALASQYDIGTNPNQIPLNQYLGTMAYQDSAGISVGTAALGIGTGSEGLRVTPVANSVNYINTTGSIAGSSPEFITAGSDTNIGLNVSTKGTGTLLFRTNTSNTQFAVAHTATANNYIQVSGGSGASPGLSAIGADTNVGLNINTKGTGTLLFRTNTSNTQFAVAHTATANNYVQITGGSGASPNVSAQGADTNVGILFAAKGTGNIAFTVGNVIVTGAGGLGYGTGSGGTQTQTTSRTQGVTLDKTNGSITLVSAAGSTAWQTFTVTNSTVAATDTVIVNQKSGTDLYQIFVTAVATGSFNITFATTGGTTTEQPVFNFAVIKSVTA